MSLEKVIGGLALAAVGAGELMLANHGYAYSLPGYTLFGAAAEGINSVIGGFAVYGEGLQNMTLGYIPLVGGLALTAKGLFERPTTP